ncbi:peptidoglycan DD-metalloendopeptidase family protein [Enterococcus faecium]|uniref:peptidoglycan DD-metalloendopeptidase family protein n=1 Tax=Enterococcus faecium TaxID=1352 RepID=UPI0035191D5F
MLLLGQVIGYAPTVLAEDKQQNIETEQTTTTNMEEMTSDSYVSEEMESSTSDSSGNSTDQTVNDSSDSTTDSTTDSIESNEENPETDNPSTSDSDQEEHTNQEETKPSETSPEEMPSTSTEQPNQEEPTKPKEPAEKPKDILQDSSTSSSNAATQQGTEETVHPNEEGFKEYHQAPTVPIQELVPASNADIEGNIYFEKDESVESFVRKIGESARKIGQEKDLYASVMIAQAILESASGQSQLAQAPHYNLFGIKGTHKGKGITFASQEDLGNGTLYTTQATFRQYENYEDSFSDYATLLKEGLTGNSHFYESVWKTNAKTYQEATKFLTGRYATDTSYDKKLNGLIETYDLTTYDKEVTGPQLNKNGYIVPLKNYTISSPFGARDGEFHRGLDLAAAQGEPIYASQAGTIIKAEYHPSWGNYVAIEHEDGTTTLYAHQQEYQVKVGDTVEQGQIIGYVGSTGNSTGSHLHFELCLDHRLNQTQLVNPEDVLF